MRVTLSGFLRRSAFAGVIALLAFVSKASRVCADMSGKQDFEQNCASCHGTDGRGHGEALYVIPGISPTDLTKLSRNNRGVFPAQRVYESIDGRSGLPSHERFDMPFWGTRFQQQGREFSTESEAKAKARILDVVAYIKSIQEK